MSIEPQQGASYEDGLRVAKAGDEFNTGWQDVQETATILYRVRAVIDREVARRAAAIGQRQDDLTVDGLAGTPARWSTG